MMNVKEALQLLRVTKSTLSISVKEDQLNVRLVRLRR